jgi:hypothetical protein
MRDARAQRGEVSLVDLICFLVQTFGVDQEGVLKMPYLRGKTMLEYEAKKHGSQKKNEFFGTRSKPTLKGM